MQLIVSFFFSLVRLASRCALIVSRLFGFGEGMGRKGWKMEEEGRREVTIGHVKKGFVSQDYA